MMSIYKHINKANKNDKDIKKPKKWECSQSIPLWYLLNEYHCLPLSHMANKTAMNEKKNK